MQCLHLFKYLWIFPLLVEVTQAAKIIFFIGMGSHSHRVAMQPLATKLTELGHQVSFLSPVKSENPDPRILEVNLTRPYELIRKGTVNLADASVAERLKGRHNDYVMMGNNWWDEVINQGKAFLKDEGFLDFVKSSRYDLVVSDFPIKEIAHVMAYKMGAKIIWFNTAGTQLLVDADMLGIPIESSWLPDLTLGSPYSWIPDRLFYTLNIIYWYSSYHSYCLRELNQMIAERLGDDVPRLDELIQNVELVLLNERFPYAYPRALPPFAVPIGGMHINYSNNALPKNMQDFIAPVNYFVFISFGSIINVNKLPRKLRNSIFEAVASFKDVKFFWKWDDNIPDDIPKNVLAMKWFPQQDLLAHPKCKGFVTQGGAMSFQQGIYHGVPMVVVPVWWDQPSMARSAVEHGVGIHLELSEITRESFQSALHEIIYNPSYSNNAKLVAQRAKAQPMPAVDVAAWWVEYILKHDTAHFKSPAMKQRWWQRRLLDIWFAVFSALLFIILVIYKLFKQLFKCCYISKTESKGNRGIKIKRQ